MTESLPLNSSFSLKLPALQLAVDSTSLGAFKTCPRFYHYSIQLGYQPRQESVHLTFGLSIHGGVERYHHGRAAGLSHADALDKALDWGLRETWDKVLSRPWASTDSYKNRWTFIRTLIWYLDKYGEHDALETVILANGKPAVELSFSFNSGFSSTSTGEAFLFCGHLDRLATLNGVPYIPDVKTTKSELNARYWASHNPSNQFSMYDLAGQVVWSLPVKGIIVDGMQVLVGSSRYERHLIPRDEGQRDEWYKATGRWLGWMESCASDYAAHGEQAYPQNETSCLSGETLVTITRGKRSGWKLTIAQLNAMLITGATKNNRFDKSLETYLLSDLGGYVGQQRLLAVIPNGIKPVYTIATNLGKIKATADHRFNSPSGWVRTDQLQERTILYFWNSKRAGGNLRLVGQQRAAISKLYYYPNGYLRGSKSKGSRNRKLGSVQRVSRLTVEAQMNGLPLAEFVQILRTDPKRSAQLNYIPKGLEVHHKDENELNDAPDNLELLTVAQHKQQHDSVKIFQKLGIAVVMSVEYAGEEEVYDLAMEAPHHNFVANGFIAHNCGKFGGCEFQGICSRSPVARKQWLETGFRRRVWDPLQRRGDI